MKNIKACGDEMGRLLALTLTATLALIALATPKAMAQQTVVRIVPSQLEVGPPPVSFVVNVTVENVQLMAGYEIYIKFNSTTLQCQDIILPPDFVYAGKGYLETDKLIDNDAGKIHYGVASFPFYKFNGSGILCQLNFTGVALDGSFITIITPEAGETFYTQLLTAEAQEIPYVAEHGQVTIIPELSTALILLTLITFTMVVAIITKMKNKT